MIWFLFGAVAAAVTATTAAVVIVNLWPDITRRGFEVLRALGLAESDIASAWLRLDRTVGRVRAWLTFRTRQGRDIPVLRSQEYSRDQIDDPRVLEELDQRGLYHGDVLELFV